MTGQAFDALRNLLTGDKAPEEVFRLYKSTLQKMFGISPERAFSRLCARSLNSQEEDANRYGAEISNLVNLAFPEFTLTDQDRIATKFFWKGLPNNANTKQLLTMWKQREERGTLASALDVCRDSYEETPTLHTMVNHTMENRYYPIGRGKGKGKGGGKGKGQGKGRYVNNSRIFNKFKPTCFACGGTGHTYHYCPNNRDQVCSTMIVLHHSDHVYLVDTGAAITLLSKQVLPNDSYPNNYSKEFVQIQTVSGLSTFEVRRNVKVLGCWLSKVLICDEVPTRVQGLDIHGILGMDFLRVTQGFNLRFDNQGFPKVSFPMPMLTMVPMLQDKEPTCVEILEKEDFILRKYIREDSSPHKYRWEVTWKWIDGEIGSFRPPSFRTDELSEFELEQFNSEVKMWYEKGFMEVIPNKERYRMKGSLTLIARPQPHKTTTPMRPVLDYRWLNETIKSMPNEGLEAPIAAPIFIRRWRSHKYGTRCIIDIRKAYLQIFINPEQTYYQCIRYPTKEDCYVMRRLGFGLNIAPKVLRCVLEHILPAHTFPKLDTYIDDNFLPIADVERVRAILLENGFETKAPEDLSEARVLGLQNHPDGTWSRRTELPKLEVHTKRGVHAWTGKIVSHFPIARWSRPCCSALKRLCSSIEWDDPINDVMSKACRTLEKMLKDKGDPCRGDWFYDRHQTWTLYTDASSTAYGAVLMIGETYVEDMCQLRKPSDKRHINVAEAIGVLKGLNLVASYITALEIKSEIIIDLKCDNQSVCSWLTRASERHWKSTKGLSAKIVEKVLTDIGDTCKTLKIKLRVQLIKSEHNISDMLSRVPEQFQGEELPFDPAPLQDIILTTAETETYERDQFNRAIVPIETVKRLMKTVHEHEGAQALYDKLRGWIAYPTLRKECQEYVRNCQTCTLSRVTTHAPILNDDDHSQSPPVERPFQYVHMDIAGPYGQLDNINRLFIITLIDRYSRFALTRCTADTPTAAQCTALLWDVFDRYHTSPDVLHSDNGTQMRATEFDLVLAELNCQHVFTPVHASWANGRVERIHRVFNERLRAFIGDTTVAATLDQFAKIVNRATIVYNTTRSSRTQTSPHQEIFTFEPWIHPSIKQFRPPAPDNEPLTRAPTVSTHPQHNGKLPAAGEIWAYRIPSQRKLQRPYEICRILRRCSIHTYLIRLVNGKVRFVHLRHLKLLTPEAIAELQPEQLPPPDDDRPLRDLRGGRGRVAS